MAGFEKLNPDTEAQTPGDGGRLTFRFERVLPSERVIELHKLLDAKASHEALAAKYDISVALVGSIAEGRERAEAYRRQLESGDPEIAALHESRLQAFLGETQPVSDVIRSRIREYRKARKMSQEQLAAAMTELGFRLEKSQISKIETGRESRGFEIEELFAFADVLRVPFAALVTPAHGEKPIRAGDKSWQSHEVSDWLVHGPWWERQGLTTSIRAPDGLDSKTVERISIRHRNLLNSRAPKMPEP